MACEPPQVGVWFPCEEEEISGHPSPGPDLPLYMSVGGGVGGGGAWQENFILAHHLGPVTVLCGSEVETLLEVLHLVGELVGPHTGTEDQAGAAEHQDCQHQG